MTCFQKQGEKKIKKGLAVCVLLATAVFFCAAVPGAVFGGTVWDKGVYAAASVLFAGIMLRFIIWLPLSEIGRAWRSEEVLKNAVQKCCFAAVCLMTLYYYNSASDYGHAVATRVMNSAFAAALLCMYRKEELWAKWIGWIQAVCFFLFAAGGIMEKRDGKELVLYTLSGITLWIYIRLLGCLVLRIRKGECCRCFSAYGFLVWGFFLGLILFRNTRTWPFSLVIPFSSLYLHRFEEGGLDRFLKNFCHGCILAFWLMFGSALLFRPYYSFEFIRYPGWFSSVASAGLFWMTVFGAVLACIFAKYDNEAGVSENIKTALPELITLGAVSSYLIMGMARTALLGTALFSLAAFFTAEVFYFRDRIGKLMTKVLFIIVPFFLLFPVVYTLTRTIPAVVGRPVWITRAEWFSDRIEKREPMDSSKFMNVPQLAESLLEKLFGIDINLSSMAGAESGPGQGYTVKEDGEIVFDANVVGYYEQDGQIYVRKDYTFVNDATQDTSNGRLDIWKIYLKNLNLTGHDTMIVEEAAENMILYHAHNSFLQAVYDHGIIVGLLFVLTAAGGLIFALIYYRNNCGKVNFAIYPMIVVISFIIAGMTEWIFHPSIPIGFAFFIGLVPLIGSSRTENGKAAGKEVKRKHNEKNRMEL